MNELYLHQIETENKQLRLALQECRKALEDEITIKNKAIEYIKKYGLYEELTDYDEDDNLIITGVSDEKNNKRFIRNIRR